MANTPRGYPYPLPTDPVAEGAQAIRNLAEAVDSLGSFDLIEAKKLAADGTFDFQAIPARYDFLTCKMYVRSAVAATNDQITIRLNNDTAFNYSGQQLLAAAAAVTAATMPAGASFGRAGLCVGNSAAAGLFSGFELELFGVRANGAKPWLGKSQTIYGAAQAVAFHGGEWVGPAAINRLLLAAEGGVFKAGSIGVLYGLRGAP